MRRRWRPRHMGRARSGLIKNVPSPVVAGRNRKYLLPASFLGPSFATRVAFILYWIAKIQPKKAVHMYVNMPSMRSRYFSSSRRAFPNECPQFGGWHLNAYVGITITVDITRPDIIITKEYRIAISSVEQDSPTDEHPIDRRFAIYALAR
ncbi:uncharacterized protein FOMMEDRAFT_149703 [Fomitiporia mediterranea MF3/22]|uniref:uncharacterized protein n=1 Tax=Fomitiporia mediterranea (strain MF3/22) TaxID=694068 RepID=UPI0004407509|nr:uncharacterized protein FOMMEDRAFT_149703 [Fomitiporia mediterranea MF3/22]EJD07199.1 hypothetical protein FOMMEDRAFT_149703 [Fomitiporia mediterranea MF3/22]